MKWFTITLLLIPLRVAWPQVRYGTVFSVDFAKDEVTIAADSRTTILNRGYDDMECKVSAFGNQFVFVMSGLVSGGANGRPWSGHSIARQAWEAKSRVDTRPTKLIQLVIEEWTTKIAEIYNSPEIIKAARSRTRGGGEQSISAAYFAATNTQGELAVHAVYMMFDASLFDSTGTIHISSEEQTLPPGSEGGGGHVEILTEFRALASDRSKNYMRWYESQISTMPVSQRRAAMASKLVELSILLHPQNAGMGFPIDVVQLRARTGVKWVAIKPNCQKQ